MVEVTEYVVRLGDSRLEQILADKREFIRRLLDGDSLPPLHQITSRAQAEWDAAGLYGLALTDLPVEVHAFVRVVADAMEVRPGTGFLFVVPHTHCGLPEGAYGIASEGTHQSPFGWWLDSATEGGLVPVPDGWRVRAVESTIAGLYPA